MKKNKQTLLQWIFLLPKITSKRILFWVFVPMLMIFQSCKDLQEEDLSKKSLNVLSPKDNETSGGITNFWWEKLDGALSYQLEIVSPSFAQPQILYVDTTFGSNMYRFSYSLPQGTYQWRIKAKNASSETSTVTRTLIRDSTGSITNQTVPLMIPVANATALANVPITFSWTTITGANLYTLRITSNAGFAKDTSVNTGTVVFSSLPYGSYQWRVIASQTQTGSATSYNPNRSFTISMSTPIAIRPQNGDSLGLDQRFVWYNANKGNNILDSLFIYYNNSVISSSIADTTVTIRQRIADATSYKGKTLSFRVKSFDLSGNYSSLSTVKTFYLKKQ